MDASLTLRIQAGAARPQKITLNAVKLVRSDHEAVLADLRTSDPQRWEEDRYLPWDGLAQPGREEFILYDLSVPTWSAVEAKMGDGSSSFDQPFRLVLEVRVDGQVMTLLSPATYRETDDMVET